MIQFNELRITPEGNKLIIDASIQNFAEYEDIYISSIQIDTQDTYVTPGPSKEPKYSQTIEGNEKNIRVEIDYDNSMLNLKNNLFFVYIKT